MTADEKTETVVLCEGYYDRAFWTGFLLTVGCTNPAVKEGARARVLPQDIRGVNVTGGQYYFNTHAGNGVRVVPCGGKDRIPNYVGDFLEGRVSRPFARLIVNLDSDLDAEVGEEANSGRGGVEARVRTADPAFTRTPQGSYTIDGGAAEVVLLYWQAPDAPAPGLPGQQTLERLVCASIMAAYPERGPCVQAWLDSRRNAPPAGPKAFAWSHYAGWYTGHGTDDFYRCLWDDEKIAAELRGRLEQSGAWQIAAALAV